MVGGIFFMGNIDGLDGKFLRLILFPSISSVVLEGELDFFFFLTTQAIQTHTLSLTHFPLQAVADLGLAGPSI